MSDIISGRPPKRGQEVEVLNADLQVLIDKTTTPGVTYFGKAEAGTAQSAARWQVFIWDKTTAPFGKKYANGNKDFNKKFSDRATYTYTVT